MTQKNKFQTDSLSTLKEIYETRLKDFKYSKSRRQKKITESPDHLKTILKGYFKHDEEARKRLDEAEAILSWSKWVGEAASLHSRALKIRNQTLIVEVKDPIWKQELLLAKSILLQKIRKELPSLQIRDLYFVG